MATKSSSCTTSQSAHHTTLAIRAIAAVELILGALVVGRGRALLARSRRGVLVPVLVRF
jgi:hypothetical protein